MMKYYEKLAFWFSINRYAIFLVSVSLTSFSLTFVFSEMTAQVGLVIVGLVILYFGLKILSNYTQKVRAFRILSRLNRKSYSEGSLKDYMVSPCGRLLVRTILIKIEQFEKYAELKKAYRIELFSPQKEVIRIYTVQENKTSNI